MKKQKNKRFLQKSDQKTIQNIEKKLKKRPIFIAENEKKYQK